MSKNLIPEIAKLLGVEMEEAFKIRRPDYEVCENGVYAFFEGEGLMKKNEQGEFDSNSSIISLSSLKMSYFSELLPDNGITHPKIMPDRFQKIAQIIKDNC